MGSLDGQLFDSAPGLFDARGGSFDGPWTGIGDDTISLTANEASTDFISLNRTDTLDASLGEVSTNSLRSDRSDTIDVAASEVSLVTASCFFRSDAVDVAVDPVCIFTHSDPQPTFNVNDAVDLELVIHDETLFVSVLVVETLDVELESDVAIFGTINVSDDVDFELDITSGGYVTSPISVVDSLDVACDDVATLQVILNVSDLLNLKIIRTREVSRGENGSSFYSDVDASGNLSYTDVG